MQVTLTTPLDIYLSATKRIFILMPDIHFNFERYHAFHLRFASRRKGHRRMTDRRLDIIGLCHAHDVSGNLRIYHAGLHVLILGRNAHQMHVVTL